MLDLTFSVASQTHKEIILEILKETQAWLWAKGIEQWTLPFEAKWIAESIEHKEFFVVTIQQETAAVFRLTHSDTMWGDESNDAIYIHSLAVQQRWRGHRIGNHILDWIETYAVQNNRRFLRLDCMADNAVLCQYYEQADFLKWGLKEIQNVESVYKAQLFEKAITPSVSND